MSDKDIIPPFIGESIERSKRRKEKLNEIIEDIKNSNFPAVYTQHVKWLVEKLEKFRDEEL